MTSDVSKVLLEGLMTKKTASIQDRRSAILAKVAALDLGTTTYFGSASAKKGDRVIQRGQGYGAFGAAGRALREATGGATLHPGDVIKRTGDGGYQLMRRGKVLGEVTHDAANKGLAYIKGGAGGSELSGPNFRAYGDLPRSQRGLVPKAPAMAASAPSAPAVVAAPKTDDVMGGTKRITPMSAGARASTDAAEASRTQRILDRVLPKTPFGGVGGIPRPPVSTAESPGE
jgi:hypothetical protein